jgi:Ca2+/Na+ antiporter
MSTTNFDAKMAELAAQQERISALSDAVRIEFKRRKEECNAALYRFDELSKENDIQKNAHQMTMDDFKKQKYFGIGLFLVACFWNALFSHIYKLDIYIFFMAAVPYASVAYDMYKKENEYANETTQRNSEISRCAYDLDRIGLSLKLAQERHSFLARDERSEESAIQNIEWEISLNNALLRQTT